MAFGTRVLDRLRDEGRISAAQYESFYQQLKRQSGERIEESLLESGAMGEAELLKFVAGLYQTRFVSTERLARANIDAATLALLPRRVAERLQCVPILHDRRAQALSVVAYDLEDDLAKQVTIATSMRDVRVFVARPAAVRAALRRFYGGDLHAFGALLAAAPQAAPNLEVFGSAPTDTYERVGGGDPYARRAERTDTIDLDLVGVPTGQNSLFDDRTPVQHVPALPTRPAASPLPPLDLKLDMPTFEAAPDYESFLETVNVLVTLLDATRDELRGHASLVARLTKQVAERLSLSPADSRAVVLAAYLHDLGKPNAYHLTALNVSRFDGHRLQAQKTASAASRMFSAARLPEATTNALNHLYERYDGQGFPNRLVGKDIPLGARIVSLVETYCDLTINPKNPYRRVLTPREAIDVLRQLASQLFDPLLVDALRHVALGDATGPKGIGRTCVLILETDRDEAAMLELRLSEAGHDVVLARSRTEAEKALTEHRIDLILAELELEGEDGFAVASALTSHPRAKDVPYVFVTRRADRESVAKGFELGAADFLVKPIAAEVVAAKSAQFMEAGIRKRSSGLAGSLRDMALPDVIQALTNGRKTGSLRLMAGADVGEIHFQDGSIVNASFGARRKEEAVYAMLAVKDGTFAMDPSFKPGARAINASTEALLLEGMRRIDEGI
jgi:response regulator RpfG family c-di-GMP phosphodiesterase